MSKFPLLLLILINLSQSEIFVDYSDDAGQAQLLFNFFHGIDDGYFVDVGAYDPYFHSNTVNLEALGWDGINVDAGPNRLVRFFSVKPFENSLNAAIGLQSQFVTLYDFNDDSSSTISTKVKDYNLGFNKIVKQQSVPSLSLKQVCERYYTRKPNFLNLDIEGFGFKALESNDWKNPKCVPEIIFSQKNIITEKSGFPQPETILFPNGYKRWVKGVAGINEAFIHQSVYQDYEKRFNEGEKILKNNQVVRFDRDIQIALKFKTNYWQHYQVSSDKFVYHVVRNDQIVDLQTILEYGNSFSKKNRPILLMNYNPNKSFIALRRNYTYTLSETPSMNNAFFNLTITTANGESFSVLIYDHKYDIKPRLLILQKEKRVFTKLNNFEESEEKKLGIDNKSLFLLNSSVQNSININKKNSRQYEEISKKITDLRKEQEYSKFLNQQRIILQQYNSKAKETQIATFLSIFFTMFIINIWICSLKVDYKSVKYYNTVQKSENLDEDISKANQVQR